jgi:hypothetical protein
MWLERSRGSSPDTEFGDFFETRPLVRDMNLETSSAVFVGSYFNEEVNCRIFKQIPYSH